MIYWLRRHFYNPRGNLIENSFVYSEDELLNNPINEFYVTGNYIREQYYAVQLIEDL